MADHADRQTIADDARAEAARRWGGRRTSDRLPVDWLDEGMASGFVLGAQWAADRAALEAAAPLIAAKALRDAADAWQWGGWSTITEPAKRPEQVPRILGIANAVTGWIRARAERFEKEDA